MRMVGMGGLGGRRVRRGLRGVRLDRGMGVVDLERIGLNLRPSRDGARRLILKIRLISFGGIR